MTTLILRDSSSTSPPRISTPSSAPLPVPTMMAVGVARPIAHGHAIISTATKFKRAYVRAGEGPARIQTIKVTTAIDITTGTNTLATLSARRWMGALAPWASSTRRTIWARTVSLPTLLARNRNEPVRLMVEPTTGSVSYTHLTLPTIYSV